ncbi:U3 small nucleolar RNA-associated protein 14-like protein B [Bienertia sinuspersici]
MVDSKKKNSSKSIKQLQKSDNMPKKFTSRKPIPKSKRQKSGDKKAERNRGPRLPSAFRKQLDNFRNPILPDNSDDDDEVIDSDEGELNYVKDLYEYEEEVAEEESKKNKRFDPVDNFEYELPEKFKDEDILSDDDNEDDLNRGEEDDDSGDESNDDKRHVRMLQDITGIPTEAFEGKKRKRIPVVSEAYPESEFNPSRDVLSGNGQISIQDLLDPLRGGPSYSKIRRRIEQVEKKGKKVHAPLPKPERERTERGVAYDHTKKAITKWEHLVKRNREAPTLYFDQGTSMGLSTVGALASEFKPRTDFEKSIASILQNKEVADAYKSDGAKILELNKMSMEEVKERQDRLAKMRSLLFRHEVKAKHIKKIKSKTYHRIKKREKLKAASLGPQTDTEAARELAEKQERNRAEARMTLRHKNQGKWAKRVLERGLSKQDEEKMNSMKDNSSSDDSSDEDEEDFDSSDEEGASKLLAKAKEKTMKLMEQEDEVPNSGVLSLPFMVRGLEKRKEAANEEAKRALEEYESSLNEKAGKGLKDGTSSGKRVFGASRKKVEETKIKHKPEVDNFGSDNEDTIEENDDIHMELVKGNHMEKDLDIDLAVLREDLETGDDSALKVIGFRPCLLPKIESVAIVIQLDKSCVLQSVIDVAEDPGAKTNHNVSAFTSGSWKKMKSVDKGDSVCDANVKSMQEVAQPSPNSNGGEEVEEVHEDSDSDSGGHMVDGMLSSGTKQTYELPTNEELIRRAFAGDDVEDEFEKVKDDVLKEENPEPEKPLLLPGWGQWTDVQKKKGLPSWMVEEHASAKRKREEALKKRKDARLKHVIISEKIDKKGEKLYAKTLPYPFASKDAFEQSIRMPIGPEYNPALVAGALTKPEVVKKSGMIIDPIKYEDVNPHEREDDHKQGGRKQRSKSKSLGKKSKNSKKT